MAMSSEKQRTNLAVEQPGLSSEEYRQHVVDTIWRYASQGGALDGRHVFHQIKDVTNRSYSTVKNWMHFGIGLPDLEALSLIISHWGIRPEELFPQRIPVAVEPSPPTDSEIQNPALANSVLAGEPQVLPVFGRSTARAVSTVFAKYSSSPTRCVWVQQPNGDAAGVVDQGEVMLVDPQIERITESGLYILRVPMPSGGEVMVTRLVHPLTGCARARVSLPNTKYQIGISEEVPLVDGELGHGIAVVGRVLSVNRALA